MPLAERRGTCESRFVLLRCDCAFRGRVVLEEVNLLLELREWGRKPPRKDMSGSELEDRVSGVLWEQYWKCCGGPQATQTRRPLASSIES
jgi:hypothetical protein